MVGTLPWDLDQLTEGKVRVSRVLHASIRRTITGLPLIAVALCSGTPGTGQGTGTGSAHILPGEVHVRTGASFTLRVRVIYKDEIVSDDKVVVAWDPGPGLTLVPSSGPEATFTAGAAGETFVRAATAGHTDSVRVLVVAGSSNDAHWVTAYHIPGALPSLILSTGVLNGELVRDTLLGVVRDGLLPPLRCESPGSQGCGVTMFSPSASVWRRSFPWTAGPDSVDLTSHQQTRRVPVDTVYVRVGNTDTRSRQEIEADIRHDLKLAGLALRNNWTGLILDPALSWSDHGASVTTGSKVACAGEEGGPPSVYEQLRDANVPKDAFGPRRLTVVYVTMLYKRVKDDPVPTQPHSYKKAPMTKTAGIACPWNPTFGTVVLLSWQERMTPTTLGHELGHALANMPGHVDVQAAAFYKRSNLMVPLDGATPGLRTYFSLGQAFRMTISTESLLARSGGVSYDCGSVATAATCPPLSMDIIRR
jgi:hypothetical protein